MARKIQAIIERPSTKTFLSIVDKKLLANCPVTWDDIIAAERIFGPDVGSLKGKTVRKASSPVEVEQTNVPTSIMSRYQSVTVAGDIMFVNKLPFFVTISRHIKFSTSEFLANKKPTQFSRPSNAFIKPTRNVDFESLIFFGWTIQQGWSWRRTCRYRHYSQHGCCQRTCPRGQTPYSYYQGESSTCRHHATFSTLPSAYHH